MCQTQAFRAAQTIITDIRAELREGGVMKRNYIEVKNISGLSQRYLPVREDRAVRRRDIAITKEYKTAAQIADQKYDNTTY